jgi:hypothetical protein
MKVQSLYDRLIMVSDHTKQVVVKINGRKYPLSHISTSDDGCEVILNTLPCREQMLQDIYRFELEWLLKNSEQDNIERFSKFILDGGHNETSYEIVQKMWFNRFVTE